ncbi:MAG: threonylcarbamoyl-AMP synthase [Gemmataceae bacterium]|nr:threonylcarbamoyl-AMP synthase [Gemmataceae bacterium]
MITGIVIELHDISELTRAAEILRAGGLVAFPTETVYGLGAHARDAAAVRRIFAAKGRPATNPVIVHLADTSLVSAVAEELPDVGQMLAERFWPGPLTLVLRRRDDLPTEVTAGGPTVAVRVPAHPVARALLLRAGVPVAAPSANRSTEVSPTTADHVRRSLGDRVDMIIDGGPCPGGIESTVLDVTTSRPRLLRPGLVSRAEIEAVIGPIDVGSAPGEQVARSPGQMDRHYAPRANLELADGTGADRVESLARGGHRVGWLTWADAEEVAGALRIGVPHDERAFAARLYAALHEFDEAGCERIVVAVPPSEWTAIHDRLRRAATRT